LVVFYTASRAPFLRANVGVTLVRSYVRTNRRKTNNLKVAPTAPLMRTVVCHPDLSAFLLRTYLPRKSAANALLVPQQLLHSNAAVRLVWSGVVSDPDRPRSPARRRFFGRAALCHHLAAELLGRGTQPPTHPLPVSTTKNPPYLFVSTASPAVRARLRR
jgi:hypothetical protein